MKLKAASLLLTFSLILPALGEEQVRALQEELRRRNIYFGDVDGRKTPELDAAVKRYQARKGFKAGGGDDRETMRSLGLVPRAPDEPPPKELNWPEEPVLKSDTRIDIPAEAARISAETGVAPEIIAPEEPPPAVASKNAEKKRGKSRTRTAAKTRSRPSTPSATPVALTGKSPRRWSWRKGSPQQLEPQELRDFISDFLKAVARNDVTEELEFYADRVDYYHNGPVDRRIIERTLRDYYKRWPKRDYDLGRAVRYTANPARGEIYVTFVVKFSLKGDGKRVKGLTENRFIINAATADPRIVGIEEHRIRG